ncbi:DUF3768 domain-containing protein [Rhizorhabdus histidinilytica]|uniref:DUF3768 domain-containing protein n=1 Tax=Rhizorhabdus histidinilytica TaxID=439228 RepID=A0A1T5FQU3_9SPHN|nr:DUF3768 domain-containing protein [Rhizorhabdus histidinilytica]SKB98480.1 Protein of unknown function [Rhizorhabdus histidinilytica]
MEIPGTKSHACKTARIRELNDRLRKRHEGGRVMLTEGIRSLSVGTVARILIAVRDFGSFDHRNDPFREHDFGRVLIDDHEAFWKIDYYGVDWDTGSPDPSDPTVTCRVLTIMLSVEY